MIKVDQLIDEMKITQDTVSARIKFIRLDKEVRDVMVKLIPWANQYAHIIAKEFYDWQFTFEPTLEIFKKNAARKNISLQDLRNKLESAQSYYYIDIFNASLENWGLDYFKKRVKVLDFG